MGRHIEGEDRSQSVLFPERLDDRIDEDSTVRVIKAFIDELDLRQLGFGRPSPRRRADLPITRQRCSRSTSTAA